MDREVQSQAAIFWLLPVPPLVAFIFACQGAVQRVPAQRVPWMLAGFGAALVAVVHVGRAVIAVISAGPVGGNYFFDVGYVVALAAFFAALVLRLRWLTSRTFWLQILDATSVSVVLWTVLGIAVADEVIANKSVLLVSFVGQPVILMWFFAGMLSLLLTPIPFSQKRVEAMFALGLVFGTAVVWLQLWVFLRTGKPVDPPAMAMLVAAWSVIAIAPRYEQLATSRSFVRRGDYDSVAWPYLSLAVLPLFALWSVWKSSSAVQTVAISGLVLALAIAIIRQIEVLRAQQRSIEKELQITATIDQDVSIARALLEAAGELASSRSRADVERAARTAIQRATGASRVMLTNHPAALSLHTRSATVAQWHDGLLEIPIGGDDLSTVLVVQGDDWMPKEAERNVIEGIAGQVGIAIERTSLIGRISTEEDRYSALVDRLPSGIVELDSDSRILSYNSAFASMCCVTDDALRGTLIGDVVEFLHPARSEVTTELASGRDVTGDAVLRCKTGPLKAVEFDTRVLGSLGSPDAGYLVVVRDTSKRRERRKQIVRLFQEIQAKSQSQADLLGAVMKSADGERRRLAADIHDGPVQTLTALGLRLDAVDVRLRGDGGGSAWPPEVSVELDAVRAELGAILDETRSVAFGLGPGIPGGDGFEAAVHQLCRKISEQSHLQVNVDVGRIENIPDTVELVLYRILQESLTNALRHSGGTRVDVFVGIRDSDGVVEVADDGGHPICPTAADLQRFVAEGHFGLASMHERVGVAGGQIKIGPAADVGTRVVATIPIDSFSPGTMT